MSNSCWEKREDEILIHWVKTYGPGGWSIILPGVTIGEGAVVGAGSVVTKDVEPWSVVVGNPAKFVKKRVLMNG